MINKEYWLSKWKKQQCLSIGKKYSSIVGFCYLNNTITPLNKNRGYCEGCPYN